MNLSKWQPEPKLIRAKITAGRPPSSPIPRQCRMSPVWRQTTTSQFKKPVTCRQEVSTNMGFKNERIERSAYKDGGEGDLGGELRQAKAARSGARNVDGEGEGREDEADGELEEIDHLLAVASRELLVLRLRELLRRLQHLLRPPPHSFLLVCAPLSTHFFAAPLTAPDNVPRGEEGFGSFIGPNKSIRIFFADIHLYLIRLN